MDVFGDGEFLPDDALMKFFAKEVCPSDLDVVCANSLFLFCGFDEKNMNDVSVSSSCNGDNIPTVSLTFFQLA